MNDLYIFLIEWDIPIYFVSAVAILISAYQLFRARRILRRAMFSLERERGQRIRNNAAAVFVIFTAIVAAILYVNLQVAPSLPEELLMPPTSTPDIFQTPLSSPTPLGFDSTQATPRPQVTPNLAPTVTLAGNVAPAAAVPTRTPSPQPEDSQNIITGGGDGFIPAGGGCNPAVSISQPRPESTIFGTVEFFGTATNPNFGFYILEMRGEGTGNQWINLLGDEPITQVSNGPLGAINLTTLPNGNYEVRLSVLDSAGQTTGQCLIAIAVSNE